jgi:phosphate transport system substrate-binding protein
LIPGLAIQGKQEGGLFFHVRRMNGGIGRPGGSSPAFHEYFTPRLHFGESHLTQPCYHVLGKRNSKEVILTMFKGKQITTLLLAAAMSLGLLAGCGQSKDSGASAGAGGNTGADNGGAKQEQQLSGTVTASGSTALAPLVKQAAADFMDKNPKVTVNVTGGGSGTGLKNVADGTSDIGNSDVAAEGEFKDKGLVDHVVAIAPFAIITNNDVGIDNLSKQQAADIFTGKITNWKDIPGGKDMKITVVHRPASSGSRRLVQQIVLDGKEFTKEGIEQAESGAMKTAVASTSGAVGYVDIPFVDQTVKAVKFDGVAFSQETVRSGAYKLYGVEHMYTKGEPAGAVKAFLDFIMSKDFQERRVEELKFLPASLLSK